MAQILLEKISSSTSLLETVQAKGTELRAIIRKYSASNLAVFGSVARGQETSRSDIDLLIDLAPGTDLFQFMAMQREISDLLGREVDLVPRDSLKPHVLPSALQDAIDL